MIKPYKFLKGYVYSDEYTLPSTRRMSGRTFTQDLIPVQPIIRLRWIEAHINGFHFRVYTYYNLVEVERIALQNIMPFICEPNNEINRERLLGLLRARFHRAFILNL